MLASEWSGGGYTCIDGRGEMICGIPRIPRMKKLGISPNQYSAFVALCHSDHIPTN
jgi:hypothetical protein